MRCRTTWVSAFILTVFIVLSSSYAFSDTGSKLLNKKKDLIHLFDGGQSMRWETSKYGLQGETEANIAVDPSSKTVKIVVVKELNQMLSPKKVTIDQLLTYRWEAELDERLRVKKIVSTWKSKPELDQIRKEKFLKENIGWDHSVVTYDPKKEKLVAKLYLDGKVEKSGSYSYDKNLIDPDLLPYLARIALMENIREFEVDMVVYDMDRIVGIELKAQSVKKLSTFSPKYPLPERVRKMKAFKQEVDIYVMRLSSSFMRMVFPHKYYFMFDRSEERMLLGYWGGDPEKPGWSFDYKKLEKLYRSKNRSIRRSS